MSGSTPLASASLIMLTAGLGIPVMAALNGQLGVRLGNPMAAAAILFAVAFATTMLLLLLCHRTPLTPVASWHLYGGGVLVAAYVASITTLGPRLGVGNAVFLVLLGQLLASALIDHFALWGTPHAPMDGRRCLGLALMVAGLALARRPL